MQSGILIFTMSLFMDVFSAANCKKHTWDRYKSERGAGMNYPGASLSGKISISKQAAAVEMQLFLVF